jgi:hypothetical protein
MFKTIWLFVSKFKFAENALSISILSIIVFLISCKVSEKDIYGTYELDKFPKTIIQINPDKTFEFIKINRNPYLHPFDHPDEYFFISKGTWTILQNREIEISSTKDSAIYPLLEIKRDVARNDKISHFTFYDMYGDSVKILYVLYSDGSTVLIPHGYMRSFSEDLTKRDTLEFHFYGYRPWIFINGQLLNADFSVTLKPYFRPNYFKNSGFGVKGNLLIDLARKGKFEKVKNGAN